MVLKLWKFAATRRFFGLAVLLSALLFYVFLRSSTYVTLVLGLTGYKLAVTHAALLDSLPSFLFVLGFSLLHMSIGNTRRRVIGLWVLLHVVHESLQKLALVGGTFDPLDLLMGVAAGVLLVLILPEQNQSQRSTRDSARGAYLFSVPLIIVGALSMMATSQPCACSPPPPNASPIYLSYEALRTAVQTDDGKPLQATGKIYLYGRLLLVNEPNRGVHVFDNSDASNPKKLTFIRIPGNVDMAVKDGFLYADSFVDLVVIDIRNPAAVVEVHRIEDRFEYNPYQAVPSWIRFYDVDQEQGVVVGYVEE